MTPDDGTIYVEGGNYAEDVLIQNISFLTLQGTANAEVSKLLGMVSILNADHISLLDFVFEQTITIDNSSNISITASPQDDTLDIALSGEDVPGLTVNGNVGDDTVRVTVRSKGGQVFINGDAGNDTLIVDFGLSSPKENFLLSYDGGDGFDTLALDGGNFSEVAYSPVDPYSGSILLDKANIQYQNIEPILDITVAANVTYPGTSGADTISIVDGDSMTNATSCLSGCDLVEIQSPQFENISFANKATVKIDGGEGDDLITLNISRPATGLLDLTVQSGDGNDTITVSRMTANIPLTLDGNGGVDTVIVAENAIISTRSISGGAHENSISAGDSKSITILAETITVEDGAKIFSHVNEGSTYQPGNITFTASDTTFKYTPGVHVANTNAIITIKGATIKGGVISINATADTTRVLPDNASAGEWFKNGFLGIYQSFSLIGGVVISNSEASVLVEKDASIIASSLDIISRGVGQAWTYPYGLAVGVGVGVVDNTAKVVINGSVATTGNAYFRSSVDNTIVVVVNTSGLAGVALSAAVSVLTSESTVHITDDAVLNVNGDLTARAETVDRNYTYAVSATGGDGKIGVAAAVKDEYGLTQAYLDGTATVGGAINVNAMQSRESINVQKLAVIPANVNGTAAIAGVGTSSTGNLLDDASSAGFINHLMGFVRKYSESLKTNPATKDQVQEFELAGGVAVDYDVNEVYARIGDGNEDGDGKSGVILSKGNVTVSASISDRPDVTAGASASKNENTDPQTSDSGQFYGSVSVAIGVYTEDAQAYIAKDARVDSGGELSVASMAENNFEFAYGKSFDDAVSEDDIIKSATTKGTDGTWLPNFQTIDSGNIVEVQAGHLSGKGDVGDWYKYVGNYPGTSIDLSKEDYTNEANWEHLGTPEYYKTKEVVRNLTMYLDSNLGLDTFVFDSFSQATSADAEIAVALAVTVIDRTQISKAYIDDSAYINQSTSTDYRTGKQVVEISAASVDEMFNAIGNIQLPGVDGSVALNVFDYSQKKKPFNLGDTIVGTAAEGKSIGAAILVLLYENTAIAGIDDGVILYADSLHVSANNTVMNISIAVSGGKSKDMGFNGVVIYQEVDNITYAQIDNGASVVVGSAALVDDDGKPLQPDNASLIVEAKDSLNIVNLAGGVVVSSNSGAGASAIILGITRDTQAVLGNLLTETDAAIGSLTSSGVVDILALNDGFVLNVALAAAIKTKDSTSSSTDPLGNASVGKIADKASSLGAVAKTDSTGKTGLGVAGDVVFATVDDTALAYQNRFKRLNS